MLKSILKKTKNKLLLPFYHLVADKTPLYATHLYKPKTVQEFKNDLAVFLNHYQPISLAEVIQHNKEKKQFSKAAFHLTFDDGLSNFYSQIAPILIEKRIPATIFINTDFVDNKDLFYRYKANLLLENYLHANVEIQEIYHHFVEDRRRKTEDGRRKTEDGRRKTEDGRRKTEDGRRKTEDVGAFLLNISFKERELLDLLAKQVNYSFSDFLATEKPYLTSTQIKTLQKQGFTFGAHSVNHPLYTEISLEEQLKQTRESLNWIQENLHSKHKTFSFPFHDIGVSKQFFTEITTDLELSFGTSGFKKDEIKFHLHRLDMEKSNANTKQFLIKEYLKMTAKKSLGKYIIKRK